MLANNSCSSSVPSLEPFNNKRKRKPAGTPDPDAEVVSLSPKTLLESDRYVCEICNQGFRRDQNLQMHRRRHKLPWKLLKRETPVPRKRVFVCPEPSCLHHHPCHALGDLVGIKKHFRRKHSNHRQWVCEKCSKGYAVHSDYKAHLKTCGTRGHSCDCGRVFSRVESFIEHQDACLISRGRSESQPMLPSSDTNFSTVPWPSLELAKTTCTMLSLSPTKDNSPKNDQFHNLELQLLTTSNPTEVSVSPKNHPIQLQLSIGSSDTSTEKGPINEKPVLVASRQKQEAVAQLRLAMAEKAYAEEARQQAKRQIELAEHEFARAKRIRQQAQAESAKAQALKNHAVKKIKSTILQITCHACKQRCQAAITEGEVENDSRTNLTKTTNI
ncbi:INDETERMINATE(ID)-DOMAIN 15, SHOOT GRAVITROPISM 5, ARABIDOPSIS THALIANA INDETERMINATE(ID)-DOMAIN 15 [Hibiscus trionum]|uniref:INDETERMINATE(ID)-DOMAIN 15, SHOOT GRAVITROPISM 5, ARABIDOPSIS THALIANA INDETERMINATE(ID)-DOMAIN 15 n=1 Tax=Hibiscus trionum TaxID=183268 RepID=A0A9W7LNR3_HIBTR|nr:INDETERMINATE(ID)-DOMAIN 15, SHOOT GRAVITROPISM 5, ARABIDOPSIS THALIANA INDETERMINATE(ID)-DOMAIN 15 [Hibiscus trionum]